MILSKITLKQYEEELKYQKDMIKEFKELKKSYSSNWLGKELIIYPKVFKPNLDTEILIKSLKYFEFNRFLEIGGGTGIVSVFAGEIADSGIVVDINPNAVENIKKNIELHHLTNKVSVEKSDLFEKVEGKFDLIIVNLPFMKEKSNGVVESAFFDENLETWRKFLSYAKNYLEKEGSILTILPNFCAYEEILNFAEKEGFNYKKLEALKKDWTEFVTFKLWKDNSLNKLIEQSKKTSRFLRLKAKRMIKKRDEIIRKPNIFYVNGHNGKHPVIIFSSFPCPKYLQGFCTPCLYSNIDHSNLDKDLVYDSLINQTSFIINNFGKLIANKQKKVSYKNLNIKYPDNKLVTFELCGEGSFLSTPEIPKKHRDKIIDMFHDYSKENKFNMQMILEAKATDFLEVLDDFNGKNELINDLNMTLLFGFESADYFVREVIYNKWLKINDFESAINKGKELGFRTAGFIFCGCHSMTQKEIIEDVKKSIDYLKERDTAIYLMLPNLQPFTLNHLLFSYGKYSLIEPRTVLEMVKYLVKDSNSSKSSYYFNGFNWSIGGLTTYPEPELFLFSNGKNITCKRCSAKIKDAVYYLMDSYDVDKFNKKIEDLNSCECKQKYEEFIANEEENKSDLKERVSNNLQFAEAKKEEYVNKWLKDGK